MSRSCEEIRPLVFRVDEGDATPDQAMRVARHLSDCTACRIARARERRLAEMLANQLDELPVGDDFVDSVMSTLPQELPVRKRQQSPRRRNWHGLKLASFGGLVGWLALQAGPGLPGHLTLPARVLPRLMTDSGPTIPDGLIGLARFVAAAVEALASGVPLSVPSIAAVGAALAVAVALGALLTLAGASAVFVAAARTLR